jgi:hypothetical protein
MARTRSIMVYPLGMMASAETEAPSFRSSAPRCAIEGEKVRPDRRRINRAVFHERDKLRGSRGFPLHVANGAVFASKKLACGSQSFIEHANPGT